MSAPLAGLRDLDWRPQYGIEAGYRDAWTWWTREGHLQYTFDYRAEDALLEQLSAN